MNKNIEGLYELMNKYKQYRDVVDNDDNEAMLLCEIPSIEKMIKDIEIYINEVETYIVDYYEL